MRSLQHHDSAVVVTLPFRASSAGAARARISSDLRRFRVPKSVSDDVRMVLSELVGNAVRHARPLSSGQLLASWCIDSDAVVVAVSDGGSAAYPRVSHVSDDAPGGRGLSIVDSLARRWWVERSADSSTVTAEIPVR